MIMEDLFKFLASINKIRILAFLITMGFLVYELRLMRQEKKTKMKPNIPQFNVNDRAGENKFQSVAVVDHTKAIDLTSQSQRWLFIILFLMAVFFAAVTIIGFIARTGETDKKPPVTVIYHEVASGGVKLYMPSWAEIKKDQMNMIQPGSEIIIGVESIPDADVDRARIKVNGGPWSPEHVTVKYDKQRDVYYKTYQVASNTAQLTIEAQLHSVKDGWLGD